MTPKSERSHIILVDRRTIPADLRGGRDMPWNNDPSDKRADLVFRLARGFVLTGIIQIVMMFCAYVFCVATSGGDPISPVKLLLAFAVMNTLSIGISHATQ